MKATPKWFRSTLHCLLYLAFQIGSGALMAQDDPMVAVEAIRRLKGTDLAGNPALQTAVHRVIDRVIGTPAMVEIVTEFDLKERMPDLLEFVRRNSDSDACPVALRWVERTDARRMNPIVEDPGVSIALLDAVGKSGTTSWVTQIGRIAISSQRPEGQREAAVRALLGSEVGALQLLAMTQEAGLPSKLRDQALTGLKSSRFGAARQKAAGLAPAGIAAGRGPDRSKALALRGDPTAGQRLFRHESVACLACHKVGREGADLGPALDAIGAKLGKDALFDAIVDPSSGISFGFEAWLLTTRDGEEMLGLMASETAEEVVLKVQGGQVIRARKQDVIRRERQPRSLMPDGLLDGRSAQEIADLLAYLGTLKGTTEASPVRE